MQIGAQGHGGLVAYQHQIQGAVLGHKESNTDQCHRQHGGICIPAGGGQTAHGPAANGGNGVAAVVDHIEDKTGYRRADGGQGGSRQNQLYRGGSASDVCKKQHAPGGGKGTQKGHDTYIVSAKNRAYPQQDRKGRTQGGTGRNAQNIGVSQGIFDDGLHDYAGDRQSGPNANGKHQPGQPDKPDNIAETAAAVKLRVADFQRFIEDHTVNIFDGKVCCTHGHGPAQR